MRGAADMERWLKEKQDLVWNEDLATKLEGDLTQQTHLNVLRQVASLVKGNSVLDVGCGFGELFQFLQVKTYVGVDSSEAMLKRARAKFPAAAFRKANLYTLQIKQFDTVTAIDFLHHQPRLEPAFSKLLSLARKRLILNLWIWGRLPEQEGPKQEYGMWGELITWYSEDRLKRKFSGRSYHVYPGVGGAWSDLFVFDV